MTRRPPAALWYAAGAVVFVSFGFTEMMGSDLWWHLAAGREMLEQGTIRLHDSWSYTADGELWRNHEWLADLIFHGWTVLFGTASLVYWKWGLLALTFGLLQRVLRRLGDSPAAALWMAVAAAAIAAPFLDIRPQLYSLLGFAILLNLALLRPPRLRELLLLFLVWVNLHGGFLFGLMLLAILLFPWRGPTLQKLLHAAATWFACAAIVLINPDGIGTYAYPLEYALNADSPFRGLGEWRPPFEAGGIRSPLYPAALVAGAVALLLWLLPPVRRVVTLPPEVVATALLTAAMSLTSRRFVILYAIAVALLLAPYAAAVLRRRRAAPLAIPLLLAALALGAYRLAPYTLRAEPAFHYLTAAYSYPEALVDFTELNGLGAPTFAYYNWGGYLHWRTGGALPVFIDGRANTLYDEETYLAYLTVLSGRPGWIDIVEDSGAQLFLWPWGRGGARRIQSLLATRRWVLLYSDESGAVLARSTMNLPPTLRRPREGVAAAIANAWAASRRGDFDASLAAAQEAYALAPWDFRACRWLKVGLQGVGRADEGARVMDDCRSIFPSRYLR